MKNHSQALAAPFFAVALLLAGVGNAPGDTHYVDANSTNSTPPYSSWATAATNIQDAVDSAVAADEIVVTNGVYQTGARDVYGMSNRVAVTKPVAVRSVNGPAVTSIVGYGPSGPTAVRCVYLTNAALLAGFTLTNGATQSSGDNIKNQSGGGVWCESSSVVVSNCVLTGNVPGYFGNTLFGGGAYSGTLINCTLTNNGAINGGGANASTLNNCTLTGNRAFQGGGAISGTLNNCTLTGNSATHGGGAHYCTLNNCTLTGNYSSDGAGASGGTLNNCIVYFNVGGANINFAYGIKYCCTPQANGNGNITNAPLFVDTNGWTDLRLQSNSPCINAGNNFYVTSATDLDGNPRIVGGGVDIGAYEFQSLDLLNFGIVSNQFGFNVTGQSNWVIVFDVSSDFTNWTPLTTNTLGASPFPFRDSTPPNLPQRFYRARLH